MDVLSSREWSIVTWFTILSIAFYFSPKMSEARAAFHKLVKAFFVRSIMVVLSAMLLYVCGTIVLLVSIDLWDLSQIKNTVIWVAAVGMLSLFKLETLKKDPHFFKNAVIDNLKLITILEFVVGEYTFPFWVEMITVPFITSIFLMMAVSDTQEGLRPAKIFLERLVIGIGLLILSYVGFKLFTSFSELASLKSVQDFLTPPILTICYLPFIFIMMLFTSYQRIGVQLKYSIKDPSLRRIALWYARLFINVRLKLLDRWARHVALENVDSHKKLIDSFLYLYRTRKAERSPTIVKFEDGWSPYQAKEFLAEEGLVTAFYDKCVDDWRAVSSYLSLREGILPSRVEYRILGNEKVALNLKLKLDVLQPEHTTSDLKAFVELAEKLSIQSLGTELSPAMKNSILNTTAFSEMVGNRNISTRYIPRLHTENNAFYMNFEICVVE